MILKPHINIYDMGEEYDKLTQILNHLPFSPEKIIQLFQIWILWSVDISKLWHPEKQMSQQDIHAVFPKLGISQISSCSFSTAGSEYSEKPGKNPTPTQNFFTIKRSRETDAKKRS